MRLPSSLMPLTARGLPVQSICTQLWMNYLGGPGAFQSVWLQGSFTAGTASIHAIHSLLASNRPAPNWSGWVGALGRAPACRYLVGPILLTCSTHPAAHPSPCHLGRSPLFSESSVQLV